MDREHCSELIIEMTPFVEELCGTAAAAVLSSAQEHYRALVAENADEPKAMWPHTRKRIYPGVAIFRALTEAGVERERSAEMFRRFYRRRAEKPAAAIRTLLKVPGLYRLTPRAFHSVMKRSFGERAGFQAIYYDTPKNIFRADMTVCPYLELCRRYGCPEIVPAFCETDDVAYGSMHPRVLWGRTETLGKGGDRCDFKLTVSRTMSDNKRFWQRFAKLYSPFMEMSSARVYDRIAEETAPFLSEEMTVLELACGSGQLSFRLAPRAKHWEATDFSENMIAEAKKKVRLRNLFFSVEDATDLPYADESFDAVMIANALHIMPEPDKAMDEIRRVLKADGILFAPTFVHSEGSGGRLRMRLMSLIGFRTYTKWSADGFASYIQRRRFRVQACRVFDSTLTPLCCLIATKENP